MKKIIITVLVCAVVVVAMSISAFAAIGDVLGYAKYTDIAAYINNYPITSYNINDYTVIVVEDLRNYGFDVTWNGDARTLTVVRNGQTEITGKENVYKYSYKAGQNSFAYVETDIVTYVNGQPVTSYNIGGQTCIYIDALSVYGGVEWNQDIRAIRLGIYDLPVKDFEAIPEVPVTTLYAADGRTMVVENTEVEAYKSVGWYTSQKSAEGAIRRNDPKNAAAIKALQQSERYVTYLNSLGEILKTQVELYRINRKTSVLVDIVETADKIQDYFSRIAGYCESVRSLYPLYLDATPKRPIITSSSMASASSYGEKAQRIKVTYDYFCEYYGLK